MITATTSVNTTEIIRRCRMTMPIRSSRCTSCADARIDAAGAAVRDGAPGVGDADERGVARSVSNITVSAFRRHWTPGRGNSGHAEARSGGDGSGSDVAEESREPGHGGAEPDECGDRLARCHGEHVTQRQNLSSLVDVFEDVGAAREILEHELTIRSGGCGGFDLSGGD